MYYPKHIFIETVGSLCNVKCVMCSIDKWTRKPQIMNDDIYERILQKFLPYRDKIEKVSFFDWGDPLIDPNIGPRIGRARELGFRGTGISTNAKLLDTKRSMALLDAGLETLIISLDGFKAETHESIRPGADLNKIVGYIDNFINLRKRHESRTRLVIRFTAQKMNLDEWPDFKNYWLNKLEDSYNDIVFFMRVHSWGDGNEEFKSQTIVEDNGNYICPDFLSKQYIFSDGSVAFCCADYNGVYELGNAVFEDPIELYNKAIFKKYRDYMRQGRIKELDLCKECSIPMSRCNIVEYFPNGDIKKYETGKK